MPKRTRNYEDSLIEDLRDPVEAAAYLNAALDNLDDPDGMELFLVALGHIIRAEGVSAVARGAGLGRESLYKSLSPSGNPKLKSLWRILREIGLHIRVDPAIGKPAAPPTKRKKSKALLAKAS